MHLNKNRTGMALGIFLGFWHAVWALLVLFGWAQGLMDWAISMHMIGTSEMIGAFSWGSALGLIIVAMLGGYVAGWVFAWIWNKTYRA